MSTTPTHAFHVLNLGAGVQSTALFLMIREGLVPDYPRDPLCVCGHLYSSEHLRLRPDGPSVVMNACSLCDCGQAVVPSFVAVFADTQEEPAAVYAHLEWLKSLEWPRILVRSIGKLGDDLLGVSKKLRFASIPAFAGNSRAFGTARRNCSRDYKSRVVEQTIRREIVGLEPKRGIPKGVVVHQYFGISRDESRRAASIKERIDCKRGWFSHFPLLEKGMTRADCLRYLASRVPHQVPRSACVFCPYHSDSEWRSIRERPGEWARAVLIDKALRGPATLARRGLREPLYLHPSRKPLDEVDFDAQSNFPNFVTECEGMCGI